MRGTVRPGARAHAVVSRGGLTAYKSAVLGRVKSGPSQPHPSDVIRFKPPILPELTPSTPRIQPRHHVLQTRGRPRHGCLEETPILGRLQCPHARPPQKAADVLPLGAPDVQRQVDRAVRPGRHPLHARAAQRLGQETEEMGQDGPRVLQRHPAAEHRRVRSLRRLEHHAAVGRRTHRRPPGFRRRKGRERARHEHLDLLRTAERQGARGSARGRLVLCRRSRLGPRGCRFRRAARREDGRQAGGGVFRV